MPANSKNKKEENVPTIFANRYTVLKKLGSGNYGTAYLVKDTMPNAEEELKVLKEINIGYIDPDETIDAVHEANLLRKLDNPFVVKFYDSFLDGKSFCIVTEYCEGGDLDQLISKTKKEGRTLDEDSILRWLVQLFLGVHYIHSRKILHRDLKSRNIFLKKNKVKIGDFGISRVLYETTDLASSFIGTPYYMSPEVLKHAGYNNKSDIWSIGCILFELCALKHAFEGQGLMGVMYKIVEEECPRLPNKYSHEIQNLLQKILVKEPTERPSAGEILALPFLKKYLDTINDKDALVLSMTLGKREATDIHQILSKSTHRKDLDGSGGDTETQVEEFLTPVERMKRKRQQEADRRAQELSEAAKQSIEHTKIAKMRKEKTNLSSGALPFSRASPRPTFAQDLNDLSHDEIELINELRRLDLESETLRDKSSSHNEDSHETIPRHSNEAPWRDELYSPRGGKDKTSNQKNFTLYDAHRGPQAVSFVQTNVVKMPVKQSSDDLPDRDDDRYNVTYSDEEFEPSDEEVSEKVDEQSTIKSNTLIAPVSKSGTRLDLDVNAGGRSTVDLQNVILMSGTNSTFYDSQSGVDSFSAEAKRTKINNMKKKCQAEMGEKTFSKLYKTVHQKSQAGILSPSTRSKLMQEEGVQDKHVFLMEQLIFLEDS